MGSTSETGHYKNVTGLDELIADIQSYGTSYNPTKSTIKLAAMQATSASAKTAISNLNLAEANQKTAIKTRAAAYAGLSRLVRRILAALEASDANPMVIESARGYSRKILGYRASPKKTQKVTPTATSSESSNGTTPSNASTTTEISASRMSYDNRADNFDRFLKLLGATPQFIPNEVDLKLPALTVICTDLKAKNAATLAASSNWNAARITRNDLLYKDQVGLIAQANDCKKYLKSAFGTSSTQYIKASRIKFVKNNKVQ